MCSSFSSQLIRMEGDQAGDLGDILRSSGACGANHQFLSTDYRMNFESAEPMSFFSPCRMQGPAPEDFGDPFSNFRDPLLHDLAGTSAFFESPDSGTSQLTANHHDQGGGGTGGHDDGSQLFAQKMMLSEEMMKKPCAIFSRVLQISSAGMKGVTPVLSPRHIKETSPLLLGCDTVEAVNNSSVNYPMDHSCGVQISSPRTLGIKRRKNQAKKVVCIPTPAATNSRPIGEVVPSDLWAWRKYGQKPIKGSPYPRGYYRCSSSKGCSARKQVERSRNDPNMLVITYTSEHNHPWPTHRNALAGSTRSQPIKKSTNSSVSRNQRPLATVKEEQGETTGMITSVKEEVDPEIDKAIDSVDDNEFDREVLRRQSYMPMYPESSQPDNFYSDLGELDPDPMNLVFPKGFLGNKLNEYRENKILDSFDILDWEGN